MARTIQSPGVEIKEKDLSQNPARPVGTTVLVPGFAKSGPTDELTYVSTLQEYTQIYGEPETPVERYAYHTIKGALNSPANVIFSRMAYGSGAGSDFASTFSALVYPVFPRPKASAILNNAVLSTALAVGLGYGTNEQQQVTFPSSVTPAGSTFSATQWTLRTPGGVATMDLSGSNSLAETTIEAITDGIDDVTVTGGGSGYNIVVQGPSATNVPQFSATYIGTVSATWTTPYTNNSIVSSNFVPGSGFAIFENTQTGETAWVAASSFTVAGLSASFVTSFSGVTDVAITGNLTGAGFLINYLPDPKVSDFQLGINTENLWVSGHGPVAFDVSLSVSNSAVNLITTATATTAIDSVVTTIIQGSGFPADFTTGVYANSAATQIIVNHVKNFGWKLTDSDTYYFGEPSNIEINAEQLRFFLENRINYSNTAGKTYEFKTFGDVAYGDSVGMVLVNDAKLAINEKFEGYYFGMIDNTNLNPATDFDGINSLRGLNEVTAATKGVSYTRVPETRLNFSLSALAQNGVDGSVSEIMENIPPYDINNDKFSDTIAIGLVKVRTSTLNPDVAKLDYTLAESYIGSLNFYSQQFKQEGGQPTSFFLGGATENSPNFEMFINPNISKNDGDWYDENKTTRKRVRVITQKREVNYSSTQAFKDVAFLDANEAADQYQFLKFLQSNVVDVTNLNPGDNLYAYGVFQKASSNSAETGNIPSKLNRVFDLAENLDLYDIDIITEGGLGTVFVGTSGGATGVTFDDQKYFNIDYLYNTQIQSADAIMSNYKSVFNVFSNFCEKKRKDCLFLADPLRYIFVQGKNEKTMDDKQNRYFSKHLYWPLRHLFQTANTSYAAAYANWMQDIDPVINEQIWVPPSGRLAATMANTDSIAQPWIAPAGYTRGLLTDVNDIAFYPNQKQRDQLYKIGLNPISFSPTDGFVVMGQKTLQSRPSAFDRINVRRMFLYAERATRQTTKYFVFEPNTIFTRTQLVNVITPIFENIKRTQGLYDYLIVADERNNPPSVIDQNELVVDIYMKPVRAAEFILVNFVATRTGQDFNELVS